MYATEAGLILLNSKLKPIATIRHDVNDFSSLMSLNETRSINEMIRLAKEKGIERLKVHRPIDYFVEQKGWKRFEVISDEELSKLAEDKIKLMVKSGLCSSEEEAIDFVRRAALQIAEQKVKEVSGRLDLQVIQSIQALDELDKVINLLATRVKEWHGLHFPELVNIVDDNKVYCKIVSVTPLREDINEEILKSLGLSKGRISAILDTKDVSKGGDISQTNLTLLSNLATQTLRLMELREKLTKHVEELMQKVAPNVTSISGPTIGARLISKAGGLDKLAAMPASTIQVLGAEKALFRSLRTGSRPPKHGILFQHTTVHTAPKWQRGKIARSLAAKIAIAARVDVFRGEKIEGIEAKLKERIKEIKEKAKEPPKKKFKKKKRRRR